MDGAMGTMLQKKGMDIGEYPEALNLTAPEAVKEVHKAYLAAGSNIILANTFGANRLHFPSEEACRFIRAGLNNARAAIRECPDPADRFAALDIGPTGSLLAPYGELPFEEAVEIFAEMVRAGTDADLIFIETMSDLYETKAALLAAKENSSLPVFVSNAYQAGGKLMTGAGPAEMIAMLEGMGADAVGVNCSQGPVQLAPVIDDYIRLSSVPVLVKPNAGLPGMKDGQVTYDIDQEMFAELTAGFLKKGAALAGGCCGTTPEYIRLLTRKADPSLSAAPQKKRCVRISSHARTVVLDDLDPNEIPFLAGDSIDDLVDCAYDLEDEAAVLGLDVSFAGSLEKELLPEAVFEIQAAVGNPLMLAAADPEALEKALRIYKGNALISLAKMPEACQSAVSDFTKKYGGVIL